MDNYITRLKDNAAITELTNLEITYLETTPLDGSINIIEDVTCYLGTKDVNITEKQCSILV